MSYPTITPLPAAPQRTQDPETFSTTADTFVAALPDLVTEVNAAGAYIDNKSILVGNDFKGTYSAGTTYAQGESVLSSSKYYVSLVDSNTGNTPASSPSQWSEIAGAPSVSGEASFTATGTITAGDLVSLLSDGTVSKSTSPEFDTPTTFATGPTDYVSVCHIANTEKYVVVYPGTSSFGTAVVVDYSTGSAVVGTPVVFNSAATTYSDIVHHPVEDVVVVSYGTQAIAASVSGTTLTFGTAVSLGGLATGHNNLTYESTTHKLIAIYNVGSTPVANTRLITVSGTTLTLGAQVAFGSSNSVFAYCVYDEGYEKILFVYGTTNPASDRYIRTGTISGTTISLGTARNSWGIGGQVLGYDSVQQKTYIFGFGEQETNGIPVVFATQLTITGTSIDATEGKFAPLGVLYCMPTYSPRGLPYSPKEGAFYLFGGNELQGNTRPSPFYRAKVFDGYFSAESLPFHHETSTGNLTSSMFGIYSNVCVDADGEHLTVVGNAFKISRKKIGESTSLNWVGIAKASVTNGQTVTVAIPGGTATGLSSLTPGADYYTAGDSYAKAGYAKIGKALSATSMLITG